MPNPIPFSVAASNRTTLASTVINYPGGYSTIHFELDIPNVADYEDASKSITTLFLDNGSDAASVWQGGRFVNKGGVVDPAPAVEFDIGGIPAGHTVQVTATSNARFQWGLKNGLIS